MSETTEPLNEPTEQVATVSTPPTAEPVVVEQKPNRLYQAAAWVALVAGTLLIISVIFFWGFVLGRHSGGPGHHGYHHGGSSMNDRGGSQRGPMMWPGEGRHGPGNFGPGGPGGAGPGNFGPSGPGQTTPPSGQPAPAPRP